MTTDSKVRSIMNLGNSIVGVSILAMPYCFSQCGLVLGTLLLFVCTLLTQWTCKMLMKSAVMNRNQTYDNLALGVLGATGKYITGLSAIGLNLGTCVAFFVIIGDLAPPIIAQVFRVHWTPSTLRAVILIAAASCVVFPLGLLRSVDSLSGISLASLLFYAALTFQLFLQCWGTVSRGWWNSVSLWDNSGLLKCIPIFALAFSCQTQLFIIYSSQQDSGFRRIADVINGATISVASLYFLVAFFGYLSFYSVGVKGDVLANFDVGFFPQVSRFGFSLSVMVSFPLMIFPCRVSLNSLFFSSKSNELHVLEPIPQKRFVAITAFIIVSTLAIAILIPNVETVLSFTGATMGTLIAFIIPSVIFLKVAGWSTEYSTRAKVCFFVGVSVMLLSTTTIIQSEMNGAAEPERPVLQINPLDKGVKAIPPPNDIDRKDSVDDPGLKNQNIEGKGDPKRGEESDSRKEVPEIGDHQGQGKGVDVLAHKPEIPEKHLENDVAPKKVNGDHVKGPDSEGKEVDGGVKNEAVIERDAPPKILEGQRREDNQVMLDGGKERGDNRKRENAGVQLAAKEKVKKENGVDKQAKKQETPHNNVRDQEGGNVQLDQQPPGSVLAKDTSQAESSTVASSVLDRKEPKEVHDHLQNDMSKLNERLDKLEKENKNLKQRQEAIEGIQVEKLLEEDKHELNRGDGQKRPNQPGLESNAAQQVNMGGKRSILEAKKDGGVHISKIGEGNIEHGSDKIAMNNNNGKESAVPSPETRASHTQRLDSTTKINNNLPQSELNTTPHHLVGTSKLTSTDAATFSIANNGKRDLKAIPLHSDHNHDNS